MTKEIVIDLYNKYQQAEEEYHKYMEQFFTISWNGEVTQQATKGMGPQDADEIRKLDKNVEQAKQAYEEASKRWYSTLP